MENCHLSKVNFGNLLDRLSLNDARFPAGMTIEVTHRCNFACEHCYCRLDVNDPQKSSELSLADWDRILDECAEMGVLLFTLTGGEPLVYQHFRELWILAKKKGFLINLFTNAALIDEEWADFFAEWTPALVSVTLYGASEATYKRVTGLDGMYARVLSALELLNERQIDIQVKGTFSRLNKDDFHAIKSIALNYCEPFCWGTDLVGRYAQGGMDPASVVLSPEEIVKLEMDDPTRWAELKARATVWKPLEKSPESPFRCGVGKGIMHIDPYGGLHPCLLFDRLKFDLRSGTVQDGWHRAIPEMLDSYTWTPGPCQTCDLADICLTCVAKAELSGDCATGPSDFYCSFGLERAKSMGLIDRLSELPTCLREKLSQLD